MSPTSEVATSRRTVGRLFDGWPLTTVTEVSDAHPHSTCPLSVIWLTRIFVGDKCRQVGLWTGGKSCFTDSLFITCVTWLDFDESGRYRFWGWYLWTERCALRVADFFWVYATMSAPPPYVPGPDEAGKYPPPQQSAYPSAYPPQQPYQQPYQAQPGGWM